jgi:subtilisin family serine protease
MPIESRLEGGVKIFEPKQEKAGRAATLTNAVVARRFGKGIGATDLVERLASYTDKVEPAAFRDRSGKVRIVYREAVVQFEPGTPQKQRRSVLARFNLKIRTRNAYDKDQVIVFDPSRKYTAERMIDLANELTETDEIEFAFPNFVSEFKRMGAPNPRREQWHLAIVEARQAWKHTRGEGITIAILDDGVDVDHPNLRDNIRMHPDPCEPRDLCGRDFFIGERTGRLDTDEEFDPRPKIFCFPFHSYEINDIHGTACAGVAAASGRVGKVYGVAPKAKILPVKIFHSNALAEEVRIADAIRYGYRFADILCCSWEGPKSTVIEGALRAAGDRGRGGRGCPVFVASGNENSRIDYPARSPQCIAVGASTDKERRARYSNHGPQLSIVAPSSGGSADRDIFTTDLTAPRRGFNPGIHKMGGADGLHFSGFGCTSSATPLVAGVAALVLSANANLSRDEVRGVLEETAEKIGPKSAYKSNGHSPKYGFGRVDAARAVARALELASTKAGSRTVAQIRTPRSNHAARRQRRAR